jgi:septum formation protein
MTPPPDLILASASPRRRELLERLGLVLRVEPIDLDETPAAGEAARPYAARLAREKGAAAVARLGGDDPAVLAADTVVVLQGEIFGKPRDRTEAAAVLRRLAGRRHDVVSAYAVHFRGALVERAVTTTVSFRLLAPEEIDAYVDSGEWQGKAGGYAIQGVAAVFASEVRGSLTNVIGLPLAEVIADLRALEALPRYPPPAFGGNPP